MKMRCWRRRTSFSTLRQLIRLQSRAGLAPFASVSCPTVNTPFANNPPFSAGTFTSSAVVEFSSVWRQPGTTPVSQALPRALAWSTILGSRTRAGRLSVYRRARGHLDRVAERADCLSQFRGDHTRRSRRSARKTGGVGGHHGQPYEKAPPPAGQMPPPRQQRCGGTIDGPMPFAFANPLPLPTRRPASRCCCRGACHGLPTFPQATRWTLR
jgi:hypothetical protein